MCSRKGTPISKRAWPVPSRLISTLIWVSEVLRSTLALRSIMAILRKYFIRGGHYTCTPRSGAIERAGGGVATRQALPCTHSQNLGVTMKKLAGIIGLAPLALVILAVGMLFFLTRLFDPNDYKEQIQQAAREQANIELTLGGDIGWSLFPWLGIELKQVGLAPIEHPEKTLASVGSMGLGVEVLPLLRKQLRMSDVILDDISLNLEVDENGVANWSTIGPQSEAGVATEEAVDGQTEAEAEADEQGQLDVAVESVRITNAHITYLDRRTAQKVSLEDVNLSTGALVENEPFDVEFLGLLVTGQPALRVRIDLRTVASFDLDSALYQLDGFDLKLDASGDPFGGRAVNMQLQGDSVIDLQKQVAELKQVRLSLADLRATGQL